MLPVTPAENKKRGPRDLAGYLVPVHADIPVIDAVILDRFDEKANVLGVKGLGELGICGAGPPSEMRYSQRGRRRQTVFGASAY